jgi:hypothetical protein
MRRAQASTPPKPDSEILAKATKSSVMVGAGAVDAAGRSLAWMGLSAGGSFEVGIGSEFIGSEFIGAESMAFV